MGPGFFSSRQVWGWVGAWRAWLRHAGPDVVVTYQLDAMQRDRG